MAFRDFISRVHKKVQKEGLQGFGWGSLILYRHFMVRQAGLHPYNWRGRPIFDHDWDAMIILDACRPDLLMEVKDEYEFISNIDTVFSMGTTSERWIQRNFHQRYSSEMKNTIYVTANPYSDRLLSTKDVQNLHEVWRYGYDEEIGTIPPRIVTDKAIHSHRSSPTRRLLVHYMQPHFPSISNPKLGSGLNLETGTLGEWEGSIWDQLEEGNINSDSVWDAYRENLRHVLNEVDLLLKNISANTVIISADHGNAFGEFGFYGHPPDLPLRCLREVPWVATTAHDSKNYSPERHENNAEIDVETQLRSLGYIN